MSIEEQIKQKKFKDDFEKVYVNLQYTANQLNAEFARNIRNFDISPEQFNILRILKGQFPNSAPLKLITERMVDRMSNTSRLVEKLRLKKLVERHINPENRREVAIKITAQGLVVINKATEQIDEHRKKSNRLSAQEANVLNELLEKMRGDSE